MKSLRSFKDSPWIKDNRPIMNFNIYKGDSILKIPKLGDKTADKLKEFGVETVAELKEFLAKNVLDLKDLGIRSLESILIMCVGSSLTGTSPYTTTDHQKENNLYLSKYGSEWETDISKTVAMPPYYGNCKLPTLITL